MKAGSTITVAKYWDGNQLLDVPNIDPTDIHNFYNTIITTASNKSNYNTYKNSFIMLLIIFIIGNSAPYYYFENLKNKDAWPAHGLGGLLRKLLVHGIGIYFFKSLFYYIYYSYKTLTYLKLGNKYHCTYIKNPFDDTVNQGVPVQEEATVEEESTSSSDSTDTIIIPVSLMNYDTILNIINGGSQDDIKKALAYDTFCLQSIDGLNLYTKTTISPQYKTAPSDIGVFGETGETKDNHSHSTMFSFILVVLFTIIFANIITLKGYPIYGVTHMYNPFSCFRFSEMIGYIAGMPSLMIGLSKYINPLFGHTHYGVKSAMYDAYKMRHIPVYDMGWSRKNNVVVGVVNFIICIILRFVQIVYIYTSASLFLNPLSAFILCNIQCFFVFRTQLEYIGLWVVSQALNCANMFSFVAQFG